MKRLILAFVFILPVVLLAYTSPGSPSGYVNDFAGMFSGDKVAQLNAELQAFTERNGSEISVVTIPALVDETIETYAEKLFQEWGIGKEKEDNGVLILISRDDREVRIEVGYGLEPIVTDLQSKYIIEEEIVPAFKSGNFDNGIENAVWRLISDIERGSPSITEENYPLVDPTVQSIFDRISSSLFYLLFIVVYLASILGRSKSWWAGGIVGGVIAVVIGLFKGFLYFGIISLVLLVPLGLLFDFLVSRSYSKHKSGGTNPPWWIGGGHGGRGGGGFGGFGGGMSGGGGASGRW